MEECVFCTDIAEYYCTVCEDPICEEHCEHGLCPDCAKKESHFDDEF